LSRLALLAVAAVFAFGCGSAGATSWRSSVEGSTQSEDGSLLLSAKRLRPGGLRFEVKVRLDPCQGAGGLPVQLSRNGKSFTSKHLDRHCRARFFLTVAKPTPIRAFVRTGDEGERVGSGRLTLMPPKRP
jgi:hypothetical protein